MPRKQYKDWDGERRFVARSITVALRQAVPSQWGPAIAAMATHDRAQPKWMQSGLWLDRLKAFRERHGDALRWAMSDLEICQRAKEIAAYVQDWLSLWPEPLAEPEKLDVVRMVCASIDVPEPVAITGAGSVARAVSDVWWRRVLRKKVARVVEHGAIKLGVVSLTAGAYCSDNAVTRRTEQKARNAALLEKTIMRNEAGQHYTLAELAKSSPANPEIRGGELMTRIRGCEEFAQANGHMGLFGTLTVPSRFHAVKVGGKTAAHRPRPNKLYDGVSTPRDAQLWLRTMWARARAQLARLGVEVYGFRVAEPHHDGTPHWHCLLWVKSARDAMLLRSVLWAHWLSDGGEELGAADYRLNFKDMRGGGAAGYMAKYIAKNIGHFDVDGHMDSADGLDAMVWAGDVQGWQRVDAWASTWGIRQFQSIGQPSVTVWREMRRVTKDQVEHARVNGDALAWRVWGAVHRDGNIMADWGRYMLHMGGVCLKRAAWLLQPAKRINQVTNTYGEAITQKRVVGLALPSGRWLISRRQAWVRAVDAAPESESERARKGAPWTGFTNCTARLTGRLRAALLGVSGPGGYRPLNV